MGYSFTNEEIMVISKLNEHTKSEVLNYFSTYTDSQPCVFSNGCSMTEEMEYGFVEWFTNKYGQKYMDIINDEMEQIIREFGNDSEYDIELISEYINNGGFSEELYIQIFEYILGELTVYEIFEEIEQIEFVVDYLCKSHNELEQGELFEEILKFIERNGGVEKINSIVLTDDIIL